MKKIFLPVGLAILALFIVAMILGRSGKTSTNEQFHVHDDGETHYISETTTAQFHVHDDGETHYGEH